MALVAVTALALIASGCAKKTQSTAISSESPAATVGATDVPSAQPSAAATAKPANRKHPSLVAIGPKKTAIPSKPAPAPDAGHPAPKPQGTPVPAAAFFKHTANSSNTTYDYTLINSAQTNGQPNKLVFVSHDGGSTLAHNDHPIGVYYSNSASKWSVFNEDITTPPDGTIFNVQAVSPGPNAFVHTASTSNTNAHETMINNPATNGRPNAILIVTPNFAPAGATAGHYSKHAIGVWYNPSISRWEIFNEDRATLTDGEAFNVLVLTPGPGRFVHTATSANSAGNATKIDNAATNGKPNAGVFITQNWSGSTYNPHNTGLYSSSTQWIIFNEETGSAPMPAGAAFNVEVL